LLTGKSDIEKEWKTYVKEMKNLGIDKFVEIYNANL